ncbi:MAG: RNA polymerase sigma factor [Myxococcales bacterium]|nr:RNA polymerase sigma factor [Myxococcales bacterium]
MTGYDTSEASDEELLGRYQSGDSRAFGALLMRYRTPLYNYILRSVRDADTAADLLQDAFTRVIRRSDTFNHDSKFSTWLYSITRNLCIDHQRKMKFRRHASLDAGGVGNGTDGAPLVERVAHGAPGTERQAHSSALRERVGAAVDALPEEQREVFVLRQLQQMPFAEIARVVGVPENTVKSRMRYALERLKGALSDLEEHARTGA